MRVEENLVKQNEISKISSQLIRRTFTFDFWNFELWTARFSNTEQILDNITEKFPENFPLSFAFSIEAMMRSNVLLWVWLLIIEFNMQPSIE